jgi:hypothetical protein
MKVRHGFVSNSSSSSFVVKASKKIPDVFALAQEMTLLRDWGETDLNQIDKIEESKRDRNSNVCLITCNYNTFIIRSGDYFLVDTCNNHPYYRELPIIYPPKLKDGTIEKLRGFECISEPKNPTIGFGWNGNDGDCIPVCGYWWNMDMGFNIEASGLPFWLVDYDLDIIAEKIYSVCRNTFCSKCHIDYFNIGGEIKCPKCGELPSEHDRGNTIIK